MSNQNVDPKLLMYQMQKLRALEQDLIKFQLDMTAELETLRLDLLGLEYDKDGNLVQSKYKYPKINEIGADTILSFLRPRITKIVSLSNLDNDEINNRCHKYMDDITYLLCRHKDEFDIKNFQMLNSIIELCDDMFYTTMMKAKNAGERDTLRKQFTKVESEEKVQEYRQGNRFFTNPFNRIER